MVDFVAPLSIQTRLTRGEFEAMLALPENQDRLLELIQGTVYEKMPTQVHGIIAANIITEFGIYRKSHPIGRLGSEVRHSLPDDQYNDRIPDISFILDTSEPAIEKGAVPRMPDVAIEIKSPDNSYKLMREKAVYYLQNGTRLVWLVYPERQIVEVYHSEEESELYTIADTLDGGSVLPDFKLTVRDIFVI